MKAFLGGQFDDETTGGPSPIHLSGDRKEQILRHVEPVFDGICGQDQIVRFRSGAHELPSQIMSALVVGHHELDCRTAISDEGFEILPLQVFQPLGYVHQSAINCVNWTP